MVTTLFRQILCPIDFSPTARQALEWAARLAKSSASSVTALYVSPMIAPGIGDIPYLTGPMPLTPKERSELTAELDSILEPIRASGIRVRGELAEGTAGSEILRHAKATHADLIVVGTHGRSGLAHLLLGSVAEEVLHHAPCPVLTVGPQVPPCPWGAVVERVLCADSLRHPSRALEYAMRFSEATGANLVLMHSVEELPRMRELGVTPFPYAPRLIEDARLGLYRAVDEEWRSRHVVEDLVRSGRPYEAIVECARERAVDLIVLGVHDRSPWDMRLLGSTTNRVVRTAGCPVLTVRGEVSRSLVKREPIEGMLQGA